MAVELLKALTALQSTNDQKTLTQAINQDRRTLDQHTGLMNEHARVLDNHTAALDHIQGQLTKLSHAQHWDFGVTVVVLFALGVLAIVWIDRLQRRIKKLEAIIYPRVPSSSGTEPTERRG